MKAATRAGLRSALRGVRALLLDLDGVIVLKGEAIAGSVDALAALERGSIPYRIVTNTSLVSRDTLSRWAGQLGSDVPPERFQSALSASAAYARRAFGDRPLYVLASDDALTEFAGQHLLDHDAAAAAGARAAAVIVGDSPEVLTHRNLNSAFRLVRDGAALIGMHRNPWWLTPDGPTIDSGAYVTALEFATGVRATVIGKPSRAFFSLAIDALRAEARERGHATRLPRTAIAMVGDDIRNDVLAGQRSGLRGVFVLTGKHRLEDVGDRAPDVVAASLGDVVAALD
jgi:HAD superfamily hydrolase (TIGR01458 family)